MRRIIAALLCLTPFVVAPQRAVAGQAFVFSSIDGGTIPFDGWRGRPVLVVNTASMCGFTPQYDDLQALQDRYADKGLVVLAVPSNDFQQELSDGKAVKEFCELNFHLTLPMTDITHVKGPQAHPFYQWMAAEHGFVPRWNFNKVLIGPGGEVLGTWGSMVSPTSSRITGAVEAALSN